MNTPLKTTLTLTALFLSLNASHAIAQHSEHAPTHPGKHDQPVPAAKPAERDGDPYPLPACPISGKTLGAMGDPVAKVYDGREVRFCCSGCIQKFEKDKAANFAKIDETINRDQAAGYPLKTSVVTGKDLPTKPYEFVYGNRLIRLGAEGEKAAFLKDAKKHLAALDKAVVDSQSKDYPLKTCPVSKEELGGEMGKPVDVVIAGRLVRLCCEGCTPEVEKTPAKFIALIDAARKGQKSKPEHAHPETQTPTDGK